MVNGDTDVALLQEVGVDGRRTRGRDNNQEILEDIFVKELGEEWEDSDISRQSLDPEGNPVKGEDGKPVYDPEKYADTQVTATREDGQSEDFTVTRERYDDSGDPVDWADGPEQGAVVVYEADMGEGKDYKVVYGSSNDSGSYGNSVLLGPGYEVKDVQREILGQDPPEDGDNGNPENRTALGVTFETPEGKEVSAISAHLTNGQAEDRGEARDAQYRALDDFAESLDHGGPVLLGGDFNSKAGGEYAKEFFDFLPFVDPPKHPGADDRHRLSAGRPQAATIWAGTIPIRIATLSTVSTPSGKRKSENVKFSKSRGARTTTSFTGRSPSNRPNGNHGGPSGMTSGEHLAHGISICRLGRERAPVCGHPRG